MAQTVTVSSSLTDGTGGAVGGKLFMHFTLQNCGANVPVNIAAPSWDAATVYSSGQEIVDPANHLQLVTAPGTSGAIIPTFNDSGGTTTDNTVTWTDQGMAPLSAIVKRSFDLVANASGVASGVVVPNDLIKCGGVVGSTWWSVAVMASENAPITEAQNYFICSNSAVGVTCAQPTPGATFNLVNAQPQSVSPPAPGFVPLFDNPIESQTLNQPPGTQASFQGTMNFCSATVLCAGGGEGGSGTVNSGVANQIAIYPATSNAVAGDSLLTDSGSTLSYTGAGGMNINSGGSAGSMITSTGFGTLTPLNSGTSALGWGPGGVLEINNNGAGWGNAVNGATTGGGLVPSGSTLGLRTDCSPNQIEMWNGTAWGCATINGGAGAAFESAPAYWLSGWGAWGFSFAVNTNTGSFGTQTAFAVKFWLVRLENAIQVGHIYTSINGHSTGSCAGFAVYTANGATKLLSWDNISTATSSVQSFTLGTPVVLAPGMYAFAGSSSAISNIVSTNGSFTATNSNDPAQIWNQSQPRSGVGSNVMSSGCVMPSSLGTLSTSGNVSDLAVLSLEP